MKAIVVSRSSASLVDGGSSFPAAQRAEARPSPLLPLVDRPFVEHLVEQLVELGVRRITFHLQPHEIPAFACALGAGERWGVAIQLYDLKQLPPVGKTSDEECVLIGPYNTLPKFSRDMVARNATSRVSGRIFYVDPMANQEGSALHRETWTGWVKLPRTTSAIIASVMRRITSRQDDQQGGGPDLASQAVPEFVEGMLSVADIPQLLDSQASVLAGIFRDRLGIHGRESERGIRLGRNVRLHRTTRLVAPVFLGDNVRVGRKVVLGPNCVVGENSTIDSGAVISDAQVLPRTTIGKQAVIQQTVVQHRRVATLRPATRRRTSLRARD